MTTAAAIKKLYCALLLLLLFASTMASTTPEQENSDSNGPLLLEAPPASVDEVVQKLDLSNGPASISLGPLVVNEDGQTSEHCMTYSIHGLTRHAGTLSRVQNWDKMTVREQETTTRVLTKRNVARLAKLRELEKMGKLPGQVQQQEMPADEYGSTVAQQEEQQNHKEL